MALCHGSYAMAWSSAGVHFVPLLFNIYMKPLGEVIGNCGLRNHQYADDTRLYLSFSTNPGEAVAVLNWCLVEVMGWMRANKLKHNPDKTEILLVGGSDLGMGDLGLVLKGVAFPPRGRVHSLGVPLDPELSLEAQVTVVARSAFLQLRLIHQLCPLLGNDCLATVTHALVTSRLDFCNALYVGLPLKMVRILQLVQNRAARLLMGTGRCSHITPVLRQLHWLPIEVWAQFRVLVMTYKPLNGLGPGYLKERLLPYMPSCPLRSAADALLREPSVNDIRRKDENTPYLLSTYTVSLLTCGQRRKQVTMPLILVCKSESVKPWDAVRQLWGNAHPDWGQLCPWCALPSPFHSWGGSRANVCVPDARDAAGRLHHVAPPGRQALGVPPSAPLLWRSEYILEMPLLEPSRRRKRKKAERQWALYNCVIPLLRMALHWWKLGSTLEEKHPTKSMCVQGMPRGKGSKFILSGKKRWSLLSTKQKFKDAR
ncbi:Cytoplasmic polyadenylation element-binding protein 1 [Varanus komodoensis]|nr:Cytoplasmic polyadenylation element-binding protein 1 [Varanus komodoensis]